MTKTKNAVGAPVEVLKQKSSERLAEIIVLNIVNNLRGVTSVLDIGCGDGRAGDLLSEGVQYSGIDISSSCIYGQKTDDERIVYCKDGAVDEVIGRQGKVDAVLLLDVLEHTRDFSGLFEKALVKASKYVVVSLPNEMFVYDRLAYLLGKELPAHSLDLLGQPEGFKHQYIINTSKAQKILVSKAHKEGFELGVRWERALKPKRFYWVPIMKLLRQFSDESLWSMGTILVFAKKETKIYSDLVK